VPDTSCKPSLHNRVMVSGGPWFSGVGALREKESYLVVDNDTGRIRQCPLSSVDIDINSCSVFAYRPEGVYWQPWGLLVDELKKLVYVTDDEQSIVHVFSYDGGYFGHFADQAMFLSKPAGLAIKPGPLAAISPITPPSSAIAGEPIVTNMDLRARDNKPLSSTYNITGELSRYQVTATGMKDGLAITIRGVVPSASEARVVVEISGVWEISVREGIKYPQNLHGSPFKIEVKAAETDPASCVTEFTRDVIAGGNFNATVETFDKFDNPTDQADDIFQCVLDGDEESVASDFTKTMTKAGSYNVEVRHSTSSAEIAGSPFHFKVNAAPPDAASSTHNIVAGMELISENEILQELRVLPRDQVRRTKRAVRRMVRRSAAQKSHCERRGEGDEPVALSLSL